MLFVPKKLRLPASYLALIEQCVTPSFNADATAYMIDSDMTNDAERTFLFEVLKTVREDNAVVARVTFCGGGARIRLRWLSAGAFLVRGSSESLGVSVGVRGR